VYSAQLADGQQVIVHSRDYSSVREERTINEIFFVDYLVKSGVSACGYIEPGYALTSNKKFIVTVTKRAKGNDCTYE
jgi:hypothetical protein